MSRRVRWISLAVVVAGMSFAVSAAGKPSSSERQARALFEQGVALSDEGKWAEALDAFKQSDKLVPSATVRFNIAATLRALGRYVEAKRLLEQILADPDQFKSAIKPAFRKEIEKLLEDVKNKVVVVDVQVSPTNADVQIDGNPMQTRPDGKLEMDPGKHVIVIRAKGYETTTVTKTLSEGDKELLLTAPAKKALATSTPNPVEKPPLYKQGWFWATVGGGVVAVVAVSIVVVVAQPEAPPTASPPPSTVDRVIPAGVRF